jgi:sodium-dependent dicarboxylate transporter 2/3/5
VNRPLVKTLVIAVVGLVVVAGLLDWLAALGMPRPARVSFAMLVAAAILWITEAVPLFVTSFLILAMSLTRLRRVMLESGMEATTGEFTATFFSDVILLFLGGFVLSAALRKFRLDEQMARWVISHTGGSTPRLMLGIMAVTAFLSMWLSNTATAAMMLAMCLPILHRLPADDPGRKAILLSVPFAANIGGLGTPIGSPPNAIAIQYLEPLGEAPGFLTWMAMGVPLAVVLLLLAWALLLLLFRPRTPTVELETSPVEADRPRQAAVVVLVTLVTVAGWMTGAVHGLTSGTVALLPVLVLFGGRILDVRDLRSLSWDVLILMGGGLCLGHAITVSGLAGWLVERLPTDGAGLITLMVVFALFACVMSSVMSNTATANLLMPIVIGMSGVAIGPLVVTIAFACSLAMVLPVSTPPNAIAFSSGEITVRDLVKPGLILSAAGLLLVLTVGRWWWHVLGLF